MSGRVIITIDQGTTSSRAIIFNADFKPIFIAQHEYTQHYPQSGWVEHDPEDIWSSSVRAIKEAVTEANTCGYNIAGLAIVNQRETTLVWDKHTGKAVYPAIVWQDRRTAPMCRTLAPHATTVKEKTGLRLDPYFSATKVNWILNNVDGAKEQADAGQLLFGTVDSFLIFRLTGQQVHATDTTNASRTCLLNIHSLQWDEELLNLFEIPLPMLPEVKHPADDYGVTQEALFGQRIPICAVAGDQQAALIGQGGVSAGDCKVTYGTGCFALVNTGLTCPKPDEHLLTTIAYTLKNQTHYAVEGSIFVAGSAVQWLRDGLGVLQHASESEHIASQAKDDHSLVVVPAFTGLGAPYWDPDARGAIFGITRGTTSAELIRATLESICFQTQDLLCAMGEAGKTPVRLKADGGMVANSWFCQFLADTVALPVIRPEVLETTALGGALLGALQLGIINTLDDIADANPAQQTFTPQCDDELRSARLKKWHQAVAATQMMSQA